MRHADFYRNQKPKIRNRKCQLGFTLVEMLVVIAIIGILAALLLPAVGAAIRRSKNAALTLEMNQLAQAIEAYKDKNNNDYPPDFTSHTAVQSHLRTAYPRNTATVAVASWLASGAGASLDPAEALVFWLSQTSSDPRNPLQMGGGSGGELRVYFEFDETRLLDVDSDGWNEYYPKQAGEAPFVYFDGRIQNVGPNASTSTPVTPTCSYAWAVYPYPAPGSSGYMANVVPSRDPARIPAAAPSADFGAVRPYRSSDAAGDGTTWPAVSGAQQWMGHKKFQILCAGLDNQYGTAPSTGGFYSAPDPNYDLQAVEAGDNLASFTEGQTLEEIVP